MSSKERVTQEFCYVPMVPSAVEAEKKLRSWNTLHCKICFPTVEPMDTNPRFGPSVFGRKIEYGNQYTGSNEYAGEGFGAEG